MWIRWDTKAGGFLFPFAKILFLLFLLVPVVGLGDQSDLQSQWSRTLRKMEDSLNVLRKDLREAGIEIDLSDWDREWEKIGAQATVKDRPLIVTMMGLHNSGKSTLVNLIAQSVGDEVVSSVSAKGGETSLPVVLVPKKFPKEDVKRLFTQFELKPLRRASDAAAQVDVDNILLWKNHEKIPTGIAVVDTPDLDSHHRENAVRAARVFGASDVVMVLLGEQYASHHITDALKEVKKANKPVIFVFNRSNIHFDHIEAVWKNRVRELQKETDVQVLGAYAIEDNRQKAADGRPLDFFDIGVDGGGEPSKQLPAESLERLELHKLRIQAEIGALEYALQGDQGLESFLQEVENVSSVLKNFQAIFGDGGPEDEKQFEWPQLPTGIIKRTILDTWASHHRGMTTTGIRMLPTLIMKAIGAPIKFRYQVKLQEQEREYRSKEFQALRDNILDLVLKKLRELKDSQELSGHIRAILEEKIQPDKVASMQESLRREHSKMRLVDSELQDAIKKEFERIKTEEPRKYKLFREIDTVLAGAELTGTFLLSVGAGRLLAAPLLSNFYASFFSGIVQWGGTTLAVGASGTSTAMTGDLTRQTALAAFLRRVVMGYADKRVIWMLDWLKKNYLSEFYEALEKGIESADQKAVDEIRGLIDCVRQLSAQAQSG